MGSWPLHVEHFCASAFYSKLFELLARRKNRSNGLIVVKARLALHQKGLVRKVGENIWKIDRKSVEKDQALLVGMISFLSLGMP